MWLRIFDLVIWLVGVLELWVWMKLVWCMVFRLMICIVLVIVLVIVR